MFLQLRLKKNIKNYVHVNNVSITNFIFILYLVNHKARRRTIAASQHLLFTYTEMKEWRSGNPRFFYTRVFGLWAKAVHFIILMSGSQTAALQPSVLSPFNPSSFMESNGCVFTPAEGRMGRAPGQAGSGPANITWQHRSLQHVWYFRAKIRWKIMLSLHFQYFISNCMLNSVCLLELDMYIKDLSVIYSSKNEKLNLE